MNATSNTNHKRETANINQSTNDSEGPRDAVSRTANVERTGRHKWVIKHAKTNIAAKLDAFIRGVIVWLIFEANSPDN